MKNSAERLIWFKGDIMPVSEAKINVLSPSSQFGANVFEGLRAYWNDEDEQLYIFKLSDHINRLLQSIKMMRFECNYSADFLRQSVLDIIRANKFKEDICSQLARILEWLRGTPLGLPELPLVKSNIAVLLPPILGILKLARTHLGKKSTFT